MSGIDSLTLDLARALAVAGLADAALLYAFLIRRRAEIRREAQAQQHAGLTGLVRVFLSEDVSPSR